MFDWIQKFADWIIYQIIGIASHSKLGDTLNFFFIRHYQNIHFTFWCYFINGSD